MGGEYNLVVAAAAQGSCQPWIGTQDDNLNWELSHQSMVILMLNQWFIKGAELNHLCGNVPGPVRMCGWLYVRQL